MSKNSNMLYKTLKDHPRKRITLEELNQICHDYDHLAEQIIELTEQGILVPVKRHKTNGNLKTPLYMRYTICIKSSIQISPDEINALHPRLTANGYLLRNRIQFVNNREFLFCLSEWLANHEDSDMMSRRERSSDYPQKGIAEYLQCPFAFYLSLSLHSACPCMTSVVDSIKNDKKRKAA